MAKGGFGTDGRVHKILKKIPLFSSLSSVELINVSVEDLGFDQKATLEEIYDRAKELGLSLCPPEVGPAIRLHYSDQPAGETLYVAMEPSVDFVSNLYVFNVFHAGSILWLSVNDCDPSTVLHTVNRFVFLRSKQ